MARRHLRRSRCPVHVHSAGPRGAALVHKVKRSDARGVILLPYKGCEPHGFDNVLLVERLDQVKIPHVTLEIEPHLGNWGQITTRLEAFLEMFSEVGDDLYDQP
jgi:benzoyl-CoA reductase/2-hydroxyglutaryl-CoA dehydratase subunit BcrC/BadD/HgdB